MIAMLTKDEITQIRDEIEDTKKPLFFFHDDPDGLSSFLILYRFCQCGKGYPVKSSPRITDDYLRQVEEYGPDKVFILDIALDDQEFLDKVNVPVVWIDHHDVLDRKGVLYFNPRKNNPKDNIPTPYFCHKAVEQDLWQAVVGCVGDWYLPDFAKEFTKKYPELLPADIKRPQDALFNTQLGEIVRIFSFILKGKIGDVMKCVKILTRIDDPYELINHDTPRSKFVFRRYELVNYAYQTLLKEVMAKEKDEKVMVYTYKEAKISFTKDIANELLYKLQEKIIIMGREKGDEIKMSLRSATIKLPEILKKALDSVEGFGGGHEYACGAVVKKKDFKTFINNLKKEI